MAATLQEFQAALEEIRSIHKIQGYDGNWDYDGYMLGLFNGLEFALALLERRQPDFRSLKELPCETCNDDPYVCSALPSLRHCEKATREQ